MVGCKMVPRLALVVIYAPNHQALCRERGAEQRKWRGEREEDAASLRRFCDAMLERLVVGVADTEKYDGDGGHQHNGGHKGPVRMQDPLCGRVSCDCASSET
jgi:hypothetical protein|uniref:Uncharacterized protein n=1 Tax=Zea mays TaxID=4577 RepID=A0A804MJ83_MAIZE